MRQRVVVRQINDNNDGEEEKDEGKKGKERKGKKSKGKERKGKKRKGKKRKGKERQAKFLLLCELETLDFTIPRCYLISVSHRHVFPQKN